ncbi:hypothetical protein PVL29_015358 [Vitis rotundifolia]|uniref:Rho GDP-dissociation inhibitor 1 n=1 Tax=Vitis rotundifolia TaxID=103349 RepID=A0AA38ZCD0_VITRO|nr:hypothetical protein PVL29_015358 [Vitis rotundifolia]
MGFDEQMEAGDKSGALETKTSETMSANQVAVDESSQNAAEEEEEEVERKIKLGPQFTLKEQLEKDKDDESLRRWKEQLLGTVDLENVGETLEPEVKILSLSIISPGRNDIVLPIPEDGKPKGLWFSLEEGSRYKLKFSFQVSNNIVSGLRYTNTVWKTGMKGKLSYLHPSSY